MHEHTHLSTADIDLAATLIAAVGAKLLMIDRKSEPGQSRFVFSSDVLETAEAYWLGQIRVEPRQFSDALDSLRIRLNNDAAGEALPSGHLFRSKQPDLRLYRLRQPKGRRRPPKTRKGKARQRAK